MPTRPEHQPWLAAEAEMCSQADEHLGHAHAKVRQFLDEGRAPGQIAERLQTVRLGTSVEGIPVGMSLEVAATIVADLAGGERPNLTECTPWITSDGIQMVQPGQVRTWAEQIASDTNQKRVRVAQLIIACWLDGSGEDGLVRRSRYRDGTSVVRNAYRHYLPAIERVVGGGDQDRQHGHPDD